MEEKFENMYKQATEKAASVGLDPQLRFLVKLGAGKCQQSSRSLPQQLVLTTLSLLCKTTAMLKCITFLWTQLQKSFRDASKEKITPHGKSWMPSTAWQSQRTGKQQKFQQRHCKLWRNCQFYDIEEEDKLQIELKVFHASYSCPSPISVTYCIFFQ